MLKTLKRMTAILLTVVMLITAAPLSGFVGLELAPKAAALEKTEVQTAAKPEQRKTGADAVVGSAKNEEALHRQEDADERDNAVLAKAKKAERQKTEGDIPVLTVGEPVLFYKDDPAWQYDEDGYQIDYDYKHFYYQFTSEQDVVLKFELWDTENYEVESGEFVQPSMSWTVDGNSESLWLEVGDRLDITAGVTYTFDLFIGMTGYYIFKLSHFNGQSDHSHVMGETIGYCSLCGETIELIAENDGISFRLYEDGTLYIFNGEVDGMSFTYNGFHNYENYDGFVRSVRVDESITALHPWDFWEFENLKEIHIPPSVTSIDENCFPESVTIYGCVGSAAEMYANDNGNPFVAISTEQYDEEIFANETITCVFNSLTKTLTFTGTGELGDYVAQTYSSFPPWQSVATQAKNIVIGEGITEIGNSNFFAFDRVEYVQLPESLTRIGDYAFSQNYELKTIEIPESVTEIGTRAFSASGLKSVTIPSSVATLDSTFFGCWNLDSAVLSEGVQRASHAFDYTCMETITIPSTMEEFIEYDNPSGYYNFFSHYNVVYNYSKTAVVKASRGITDPYYRDLFRLYGLPRAGLHSHQPEAEGYDEDTYWHEKFPSLSISSISSLLEGYSDDFMEPINYGQDWRDFSNGTIFFCYSDSEQHNRVRQYYAQNNDNAYGYDGKYDDEGVHFLIANNGTISNTACVHSSKQCSTHRFWWIVDREPICGNDGLQHQVCTRCGTTESWNTAIPAPGKHVFNLETVSAETEAAAATCTEPARYYYTCSVCGAIESNGSHVFSVGDPLGHSFTSTIYASNNDASHKTKCIRCNVYGSVVNGEQTEGESEDCTMGNWGTVTPAVCEADGLRRRTCTKCGYAEEEVIGALGHSFTSTICESNNDGTHKIKCLRCEKYGAVIDNEQTEGASETCSMSAWNIVTPATCEANGLKRRACLKCGYAEEVEIPALDHSFTSTTFESNNDGTHKIKCIRCEKYGAVIDGVQKVGASVDCSMGNWGTVTPAVCEADGLRRRTCVKCGFAEEEVIGALGHSWNTPVYHWTEDLRAVTAETTCKHDSAHKVTETVETSAAETTAPTCVKDGVRTYTAVFENDLFFNQTQDETIDKLGHDYRGEHFDPVGEEDGYTRYTCTRCTDSYTVLDPAAAVEELIALEGAYRITLSWKIAKEASVTGYQVYRKAPGETEFSFLALVNSRRVLSYVDAGLTEGETYVYRVCAMKGDVLGAESEAVSGVPFADTTAPTIGRASPDQGYLTGNAAIEVDAEDDFAIQSVTATLISQINDAETVVFAQTLDPAPAKQTLQITFDSAVVADGIYTLRLCVEDACGNETNKVFGQYAVNNEGPSKVQNLQATAGATQATLRWDDVADDDRACFNIYRKSGEEWLLVKDNVKEADAATHKVWTSLTGLQPDTTYSIAVAAVDTCKNVGEFSDVCTFKTKSDTTVPIITSISPNPQTVKDTLTITVSAVDPDGTLDHMILQASSDKATWTDIEEKAIDSASSQATVSFTMSFAAFEDGSVFVRGVAVDTAGNRSNTTESAPFVEYAVDTTAPAAPENVKAAGGDGYVEVSWDDSTETDKNGYYVYRSESEADQYQQIAAAWKQTKFTDYTVQIGKTYYYKVSLEDNVGNMSAFSAVVSAAANEDHAAPVLTINGDLDGVVGGTCSSLSVSATDRKLDSVVVEYKRSSDAEYSSLLHQTGINAASFKREIELPLDAFETGDTIFVRAYASDAYGNRSEEVLKEWSVDKTAPVIENYSVSISEGVVTVTWNGADEADLSGYRLYCNDTIVSMQSAGETAYTFTHSLTGKESGDYTYKLIANDKVGNTAEQSQTVSYVNESQTEVPGEDGEPVKIKVVAAFECERNMITEVQEVFDASASYATGTRIFAYAWDFGDGTTSKQMRPKKTFHAVGDYTVTLTVLAESGHVARASKTVHVEEPSNLAEVSVCVFDPNGNVMSGVPVTFDAFSQNPETIYVGNDMKASMLMTLGTHYIGIQIGNRYPVYKKVDVVRGAGVSVRLDLTDEQMVTAKFTVKRMSLDEIKDLLGDRIYDEAYQQVLKAVVCVEFGTKPGEADEWWPKPISIQFSDIPDIPDHFHQYGEGKIIKEPTSCAEYGFMEYTCIICGYKVYKLLSIPHAFAITSRTEPTCSKEGKVVYKCSNCKKEKVEMIDRLPHVYGAWIVVQKPNKANNYVGKQERTCIVCGFKQTQEFGGVEDDSRITMRTKIPVKASFLAEFFEISVEFDFNGTSEFALNDCAATLNLPSELSLYEGTPATQWIGTMQGGTGKSVVVTWYVYGKEAGTYSFSADFTGVLNMTGRRCNINFPSDETITIYGRDAATIVYQFDEELHNGDFYFAIGLEASGPIPLYLPNIELLAEGDELYFPMKGEFIQAKCQTVLIQHADGTEEYVKPIDYDSQPLEILEPGAKLFKIYKVKSVIKKDEVGYFKDAVVTYKNHPDVQVRIETRCMFEPLVASMVKTFGTDGDANENITFDTGTVNVTFERDWFRTSKPNTVYNHDLAKFCAAYSMLGYAKSNEQMKSYLSQCGFEWLDSDMDTSRDEVNTFVAAKTITVDSAKKNLIFVGTIGSNGDQWYSDFDPYAKDRIKDYAGYDEFGQTHLSFADAREYAYQMLKKAMDNHYLSKHPENNILLFIGHSRGAAAANLLAAKAIDEHIWADQSRIYAYTFATPNATNNPDVGAAQYQSIFNIVNPEDFVTKVMLRFWGYNRYGQTMVLPSRTNTYDDTLYNRWLEGVRNKYSQFKGKYYTPYPDGEKATFDIIHSMYSGVESVNALYFDNKYPYRYLANQVNPTQTVVQIDEEASPYRFLNETVLKILVNYHLLSGNSSISELAEGVSNAYLVLNNPRADFYKKLLYYFFDFTVILRIEAESFLEWAQVVLGGLVSGRIKVQFNAYFDCAHTVETYCAYMYTLTGEELTRPKGGYWGKNNCPVDIEIVDKATEEVVGRIVDNTVDEEIAAKENAVVMTVDGDEKSFWLPSDGDYDVRFVGNDTGVMDYTLKEIDSDAGELKRTNFFNVALTEGKTYTSEIGGEAFALETYALHCDDDTTVQPDEVIDEPLAHTYSVTTAAQENGQASGDGVFTSGDYATLQAFPDEGFDFAGWYEDDVCVSTDSQYRFRVDKNATFTASFKPSITHTPGDINGDGKVNNKDLNRLMKYLAGENVETVEAALDVNGDGKVNNKDLNRLMKHLAGENVEIH